MTNNKMKFCNRNRKHVRFPCCRFYNRFILVRYCKSDKWIKI